MLLFYFYKPQFTCFNICFIELYCIYIISVLYLYGICKLVKYVKPQFSCWSGGWARLTGEDCGGLRSTMMIKIYFYLMEIYCGGLRNTMIKCMKIYLYSPEWGIQWWKYICTNENIFLLDGNICICIWWKFVLADWEIQLLFRKCWAKIDWKYILIWWKYSMEYIILICIYTLTRWKYILTRWKYILTYWKYILTYWKIILTRWKYISIW